MCGARCWNPIRDTRQSRPTLPSWRLLCWRYEMICNRSSLIRQSYHFARDFDHVLLQLVDTLNTLFKHRAGSWHSSLKRLNCWRKVVQRLIRVREYSARDCMFTWKSELWSLNCCIFWTISAALMKFAGYVVWILLHKLRMFGSNSYCYCWYTKVFLGDCFYWRTLYNRML